MESSEEVYRERSDRFGRDAAAAAARSSTVSNLRLAAFVLLAVCVVLAVWLGLPVLTAPAALLLVVFGWLVWHHAGLERRRREALLRQRINDEALARLGRRWNTLPHRLQPPADPAHPYAQDLDLFGRASLLHLLDCTTGPMGSGTLAGWLLAPADPGVVEGRQAGVRELASLLELREELQVRGRSRDAGQTPDPEPFLAWCEDAPWLRHRPALLWAARLSPLLLWASLVAWLVRLAPVPLWPVFLVANLGIGLLAAEATQRVLARVVEHKGALDQYGEQLGLLAGAGFSAPDLERLRSAAAAGGVSSDRLLRRLDRIVGFAVPPGSVAWLALQALFLWNVHVLWALERWQALAGGRARTWLQALGELEALASLAGLAHAHPSWAFPELDPDAEGLVAEAIGHPLLPPAVRIDNDVSLGPPGTFLLVTGSNMSGKSTLLRSIGVNSVLAAAGAPVCARRLRLPPVRLWTSMRVADSLEEGVSQFLAEVRRLKQIVDAASEPGARLLYLLDEVLRGTNTAERQVAARRVIAHLAGRGTLGCVSTHDLTVADTPRLAAVARPVHLKESITARDGRPAMSFDYRLRPGLATSTNALRLMEAMGLSLEGEEEGE
ncbi:MAG: DNA mismatch repair protein MutS [Candidatus Dormibacteraeota bacterium]|nr:DNA mismatch repair protein MutS [Candidatus Dormibacteraeota bacterium]